MYNNLPKEYKLIIEKPQYLHIIILKLFNNLRKIYNLKQHDIPEEAPAPAPIQKQSESQNQNQVQEASLPPPLVQGQVQDGGDDIPSTEEVPPPKKSYFSSIKDRYNNLSNKIKEGTEKLNNIATSAIDRTTSLVTNISLAVLDPASKLALKGTELGLALGSEITSISAKPITLILNKLNLNEAIFGNAIDLLEEFSNANVMKASEGISKLFPLYFSILYIENKCNK